MALPDNLTDREMDKFQADSSGNTAIRVINTNSLIENKSTVSTADATVTDIDTVAVAEGEVYWVQALIIAQEDDESNRASYKLEGLFYRNTAGNVTQEGITNRRMIESDATWDANLVADTSNQTVDIRVTGVAATDINWQCITRYQKL